MTAELVKTPQNGGLLEVMGNRFGIAPGRVLTTLKETAFRGNVSDEQMIALLVVANQYGLNPWTKEIYAFPDRNGIVPVVGLDGWSRIINSHPQFDGMDFEQNDESCTCIVHRKDRSHPVRVTEWLAECKRDTQPWKSHPKRMLRHKAMIQAARLAFGFVGIFDHDEAEKIAEDRVTVYLDPRPDKAAVTASRVAEEVAHVKALLSEDIPDDHNGEELNRRLLDVDIRLTADDPALMCAVADELAAQKIISKAQWRAAIAAARKAA